MNIGNLNGALALVLANFIGKIFGAIYRIPLSNLLGAEGIGLYQMAFPIYSFFLTFITGGISVTLSRKIASLRATNNDVGIYKNFIIGKRLSLYFGLILTILLATLSYPLSFLQGNINAFYGYIAVCIGFIFASILGAYRGYYQGFGNMYPTAISQIVEQTFKLLIGLTLAWFLGRSSLIGGVVGALLGVSLSEVISYLYFVFSSNKIKKYNIQLNKCDYQSFIKESMPISVSYAMLPLSALIDSFLIINLLQASGFSIAMSTSLYGIETGMILPLINIPNVIITAIAISSLPSLSYKLAKNENIANEISKVIKLVFIFMLPCSAGMFILASPIVSFLYPGLNTAMHLIAVNLLRFSVFEMFFLCFLTISNSCLQALSKIKLPMISIGCGVVVKIVMSAILVLNPNINILGLVLASFTGYFVGCAINIVNIKKITRFRLGFKNLIVPIFSTMVMATFLILCQKLLGGINSFVALVTCVGLSVIIYFGITAVFGELNIKELKKLLQKSGG